MEKGETIVEACKREVLEETGLAIDCTTLLMVESAGGAWMRLVNIKNNTFLSSQS